MCSNCNDESCTTFDAGSSIHDVHLNALVIFMYVCMFTPNKHLFILSNNCQTRVFKKNQKNFDIFAAIL